LVALPGIEPGF